MFLTTFVGYTVVGASDLYFRFPGLSVLRDFRFPRFPGVLGIFGFPVLAISCGSVVYVIPGF